MAFVRSSVGLKAVMAVTGLLLYGFLAAHLAGNLQIFAGSAFNKYAHMLTSSPLLVPMELGLLAVFAVHVVSAIAVSNANRLARPIGYEARGIFDSVGGRTRKSVASSTMIYTGVLVAAFVVWHVADFKYGPAEAEGYVATIDGVEMRDLRRLVLEEFSEAEEALLYAAAMVVLGFHLWHALGSALQTLGVNHPRWETALVRGGQVIAVLIAGGFFSIPLLVLGGFVR